MVKYRITTKLKAVKIVLEEERTCGYVANKLGVAKRTVQRWVEYYRAYGEEGLQLKTKEYDSEFKREVVEYVLTHNTSYCKAALHFKIPHDGIVCKWEEFRVYPPLSNILPYFCYYVVKFIYKIWK